MCAKALWGRGAGPVQEQKEDPGRRQVGRKVGRSCLQIQKTGPEPAKESASCCCSLLGTNWRLPAKSTKEAPPACVSRGARV